MDRNLGAMSAEIGNNSTAGGLFYEYGRKEPFNNSNNRYNIKGVRLGGAIAASIQTSASICFCYVIKNPNNYIYDNNRGDWCYVNPYSGNKWNNPSWFTSQGEITLFDPCPQGWTLPRQNVFKELASVQNADSFNRGYSFYLSGIKSSFAGMTWFPATGIICGSGGYFTLSGSYGVIRFGTIGDKYMVIQNGNVNQNNGPISVYNYGITNGYNIRCIQE